MSYDKPVTASGETPVGDESDLVPEPAPHDCRCRAQHLAHTRATHRPLVPDDYDITRANCAIENRLRRAFLAFEDPGAASESQPFLARDLRDRALRSHIPVENHQVAVLLQRI